MAHLMGGPTEIAAAEIIADLSSLDGPSRSRSRRVAISAVQGFLALHQAGGFVAVIRPFASPDAVPSFSRREPEFSRPSDPAHDPVILPGGRYLLLSDRRGASVIDLWNTLISAATISHHAPRRFAAPGAMTCPPIALGESKVGLILGTSAPYSWLVWDLNKSDSSAEPSTSASSPLKITGGPCEVALVAGKTLTFATPDGHWAWRVEDAEAGRVDLIRKTWPGPHDDAEDDVRVVVARRADHPNAFVNPSQVFVESAAGGRFYWHFPTTDGRARSYRVNPTDLVTDDRFHYDGIAPIGLAVRPGQNRPSMIFDKNDMLFEERDVRDRLSPCQVSLPGEGRAGLQLVGNLIVTIGKARGNSQARPIEIQSLWGSRPGVRTEDVPGLASDPLVWSGHLFTVERPEPNRLILVRRALRVPSEVSR